MAWVVIGNGAEDEKAVMSKEKCVNKMVTKVKNKNGYIYIKKKGEEQILICFYICELSVGLGSKFILFYFLFHFWIKEHQKRSMMVTKGFLFHMNTLLLITAVSWLGSAIEPWLCCARFFLLFIWFFFFFFFAFALSPGLIGSFNKRKNNQTWNITLIIT